MVYNHQKNIIVLYCLFIRILDYLITYRSNAMSTYSFRGIECTCHSSKCSNDYSFDSILKDHIDIGKHDHIDIGKHEELCTYFQIVVRTNFVVLLSTWSWMIASVWIREGNHWCSPGGIKCASCLTTMLMLPPHPRVLHL